MPHLLILLGSARAACPEPVDTSRFVAQLDLADARFAAMDGTVFAAAMDEASFLVPCLAGVVPADVCLLYTSPSPRD